LSIFHTLVYKVSSAVNRFEDDGPGELPENEEEHSEANKHPKD
jgi:hypothetical protein